MIAAALSAGDDAGVVATFDQVMERCRSASGPAGDPMDLLTLLLERDTDGPLPPVYEIYFRIGAATLRLGRADVTKQLAEQLARKRVVGMKEAASARARAHHLRFLLAQKGAPAAARRSAKYADRAYRKTNEVSPSDLLAALAEYSANVRGEVGDGGPPRGQRPVKRTVKGRRSDSVYGLEDMQEYLADHDVPVRRGALVRALNAGEIEGAYRETQGKKAWVAFDRVLLGWSKAR